MKLIRLVNQAFYAVNNVLQSILYMYIVSCCFHQSLFSEWYTYSVLVTLYVKVLAYFCLG